LLVATNCIPTAPAAPVLFTTPTGFFSTFSIAAATGRAVRSATPPGGNGATIVIGRDGYESWAKAVAATLAASVRQANTMSFFMAALVLSRPGRAARASPNLG
jgi:hypothetical protein